MTEKQVQDERRAPQPRALTIKHFCEVYDISRSTVWRRLRDGSLRSIALRPGGKRLILLEGLEPPPPSVELTAARAAAKSPEAA